MKAVVLIKQFGKWLIGSWAIPRIAVFVVSAFALIGIAFAGVYVAMQYGLLNVRGSSASRNLSLGVVPASDMVSTCKEVQGTAPKNCDWTQTTEWGVLSAALRKDSAVIQRVASETGVSARMIASAVVPEQLRYFTSNRESFKKYFEPLKILSSLTKFSLGVSGIKQDTAVQIERYANNPNSQFYPGPEIAALLTYPEGVDREKELFNRLTDSKNHYYSYLYTAAFIKEIEAHWARSGYNVSNRPDVSVTLFNIGFGMSKPNANPRVAGSVITLGGRDYSFGELGTLFYKSDELLDILPR